jgi:syntaxin 16
MNFNGLSVDKKSLYSEMKIFIRKKYSTTFSTRPIYKTVVNSNLDMSEENILMKTTENFTGDHLSFYSTLKNSKQTYYGKLGKAKTLVLARFKNTFNTSKAQDTDIERALDECYTLVKNFEGGLKSVSVVSDNRYEQKLITSIKQYLSSELAKMIKDLKKEEQKFFSKMKETDRGGNISSFDFINEQHIDDSKRVIYNDRGDKLVMTELSKQNQNEDIIKIVSQINGLTQILNQMNEMVLEQGTIVDRVDFNLQVTLDRTQKGNLELFKVKEELEKGCAAKLLRMLVVANILVFLLILLKYK